MRLLQIVAVISAACVAPSTLAQTQRQDESVAMLKLDHTFGTESVLPNASDVPLVLAQNSRQDLLPAGLQHDSLSGQDRIALMTLALNTGKEEAPVASVLPEAPVYYLSLAAGRNNLTHWPAKVNFGAGVTFGGLLDLQRGSHFGLLFGREDGNVRVELEAQQGHFGLVAIHLADQSERFSAHGSYDAITLNVARRIPLNEDFSGFIGLGVGWGKTRLPGAAFSGGCHCFPEISRGSWITQARLGMEYRLGTRHYAFAQYTRLFLPGMQLLPSADATGIDYPRHGVSIVSIGYRLDF